MCCFTFSSCTRYFVTKFQIEIRFQSRTLVLWPVEGHPNADNVHVRPVQFGNVYLYTHWFKPTDTMGQKRRKKIARLCSWASIVFFCTFFSNRLTFTGQYNCQSSVNSFMTIFPSKLEELLVCHFIFHFIIFFRNSIFNLKICKQLLENFFITEYSFSIYPHPWDLCKKKSNEKFFSRKLKRKNEEKRCVKCKMFVFNFQMINFVYNVFLISRNFVNVCQTIKCIHKLVTSLALEKCGRK